MTKADYTALLKPNQKLVDYELIQIGEYNGLPYYEARSINPPLNFKTVHTDPLLLIHIVEDLDYVQA